MVSDKKKVKEFLESVIDCLEEEDDYEKIWANILDLVGECARDHLELMDPDEAYEYVTENLEPI